MNPLARTVVKLFTDFWPDVPTEEQWRRVLYGEDPALRRYRHILALLPANPRCLFCNAPFRGPVVPLMRILDRSPSHMNPRFCRVCLETIPVGGAEVEHTMFFADVRGSTSLAERMSPAEFGQLINRFYVVSSQILTHTDALVDKLVGDQVTGFYLPGFAGPQHAQKALLAGLELLRATGHGEAGGPWLHIGIGIHTGSAFVGALGAAGGITNITALGDAVNVTARLSTLAAAGELLATEEALRAAGMPPGDWERRELSLKGRSQPITAYALRPLTADG